MADLRPDNRRPLLLVAATMVSVFTVVTATAMGYLLWAHAAVPRSVEILGFVGNIGEWEMSGTVERQGEDRELAGPMKMKHVGLCSQDGPPEKSGELRVRYARLSSSIVAKVRFDGIDCDFSGSLTDAYTGLMSCPDRRPVQMLMWLR